MVGAGARTWRGSRRLMALGILPGVVTALIFGGGVVMLLMRAGAWAESITASITGDPTPNRLLVALLVVAMIGGAVLLIVYTFTAVTLLIGQPVFEHLSDRVGDALGLPARPDAGPWWRHTLREVRESLGLLGLGLIFGIALVAIGLVPVVGGATAFALGAIVGGRFMSLELTAYPLGRMGARTLAQRRAALRARRSLVWGFGVAAYLVCLIPLGAVLFMPALIAGAAHVVNALPRQSPEASAVLAAGAELGAGAELEAGTGSAASGASEAGAAS